MQEPSAEPLRKHKAESDNASISDIRDLKKWLDSKCY